MHKHHSTDYAVDWIGAKVKEGAAELVADYITAAPIMIGVAIGVYVLINMISSKLASLGVVGVFVYGALVIIA